MKRSVKITLLLSGALYTVAAPTGCRNDPAPPPPTSDAVIGQYREDQDQDNNSYVPGVGYYHSAYHTWYPYPFNWYYPRFGYYYGGGWHESPVRGAAPAKSRPLAPLPRSQYSASRSPSVPGAVAAARTGHASGPSHPVGISRGGFGGTGHAIGGHA